MQHCRRLVPLLALVLVIQSLVTVLPHTHQAKVEVRTWQAPSSFGASHHCLACSVFVPVVEPAAESGHETGTIVGFVLSVETGSSHNASVFFPAHPRAPPRVL